MIRRLNEPVKKIAFISSFAPRKCGIATFTSDMINNMAATDGEEFEPWIFAMQSQTRLQYDKPVVFTINKDVKSDYACAADFINSNDIDVVSVQHEFGLFGGNGGSYLSFLLRKLNKPVVTTLHTVLEKPAQEYFDSLIDVCDASNKVIVMNQRGIGMLQDIYGVSEKKIELIPHGIPDLPLADSGYYKYKLGFAGRRIILTFGLLNKNKGIEVMLRALPKIVEADPSVLYIILGATHPEVLRSEGQSYKLGLEKMVRDLGLQRHVAFYNRFVEDEELFEFLGAADIYVTPYLHKEQLTSGTLAFAVGTGKAVVSTPYWAAEELLADGRGRLVQFGNSEDTARSIVEIFENKTLFSRMKEQAYEYGRSRTWAKAGRAYWDIFRTQEPSMSVSGEPKADSRSWKIPETSRRSIYQSV